MTAPADPDTTQEFDSIYDEPSPPAAQLSVALAKTPTMARPTAPADPHTTQEVDPSPLANASPAGVPRFGSSAVPFVTVEQWQNNWEQEMCKLGKEQPAKLERAAQEVARSKEVVARIVAAESAPPAGQQAGLLSNRRALHTTLWTLQPLLLLLPDRMGAGASTRASILVVN